MTESITCPRCGMTSWNPNDVREGYCGHCHDYTSADDPWLAGHSADILTVEQHEYLTVDEDALTPPQHRHEDWMDRR